MVRVCKWFMNKVRRGAKTHLIESKKGVPNASADSLPGPKSISATRNFLGWTESKLRRLADCLHCQNDDQYGAKTESKYEPIRNGEVDALQRLQRMLKDLRGKLHRKEGTSSMSPELSGGKASKEYVTCVPRELTRVEKRPVCGNFVRIIQEKSIRLTVDQQASVAYWMIQTLQDPDFSLDLGDDAGFEGQDGGNGKPMIGKEDTGESEIQNDAKDQVAPIDQAYVEQPFEHTGVMSDGEDTKKMSKATVDSDVEEIVQEDLRDFDLVSVCIALARDNLDERRMQRLRDGFFGLLNQTL